ncbi:hypothetical protein Y032_0050g1973 [Ancylostoma ceylanicum]|uniref:Uncharacterized protein n=1 Tax=Ancylostoma ceylanicum TaxID=53326 RepID=A0A016U9I6_9BILA|nr:hypothetical protein Y032_0050g1973 [Ancylostoma ceylanicum]
MNLLSFPSPSGLSPGNSAFFCKRAEVVVTRTVFLVGFVKVDRCAKFPWVLPLMSMKDNRMIGNLCTSYMIHIIRETHCDHSTHASAPSQTFMPLSRSPTA